MLPAEGSRGGEARGRRGGVAAGRGGGCHGSPSTQYKEGRRFLGRSWRSGLAERNAEQEEGEEEEVMKD